MVSIAVLLYTLSSAANAQPVASKTSKIELEPWQVADAARLRKLYFTYRGNGGLKQEEFAEQNDLKSQGNLGHYLHGRRPLNLSAAIGFATGMGVPIEAFSPTLAAELAKVKEIPKERPTRHQEDGWPFPSIDRERFDRLTKEQKIEIQGAVRSMITTFEGPTSGEHPTDSSNVGPLKKAA